jgi:hypothetical protein
VCGMDGALSRPTLAEGVHLASAYTDPTQLLKKRPPDEPAA